MKRILAPVAARSRRRGVTLIEVLIVVSILSLLAAGIAVAVIPMGEDAKRKAVEKDATVLRGAAQYWQNIHSGECPTPDVLLRDRAIDAAWKGVDTWQKPYRIACEDGEVRVISCGPDKREGTADDIIVPAQRVAGLAEN